MPHRLLFHIDQQKSVKSQSQSEIKYNTVATQDNKICSVNRLVSFLQANNKLSWQTNTGKHL